ncbi:unnamed protein product [Symbiodinium sp. KB8]|nr:unnamed protein product [Symbiodinium sp. KB8]
MPRKDGVAAEARGLAAVCEWHCQRLPWRLQAAAREGGNAWGIGPTLPSAEHELLDSKKSVARARPSTPIRDQGYGVSRLPILLRQEHSTAFSQAVLRLHIYGATLLQGGSLIGCPSRPVVGNSALLRHLMLLTRTSPIKVVANGRQGVRDMSL